MPQSRNPDLPAGYTASLPASPMPTAENDPHLLALQKMVDCQMLMMDQLQGSSMGGGTLSPDGLPLPSRGKDHAHYERRIETEGLEVSREWWVEARKDAGVEDGFPFSAKLYGERVLSEQFKGHSTLHRFWLMLSAIHRLLWIGQQDVALAQLTQCLKATATCLKQGGVWKGAWDLTHLPDIAQSSLGVGLQERAANCKHLRELKTVEEIIEAARKDKS